MIDGVVETQIKSLFDAAFTTAGISALVVQAFSPETQGAAQIPEVMFSKLFARRYGFQGRTYVFDDPDFTKTEKWFLKATYQVNTLVRQDVVDLNALNAYDMLDLIAGTLQSSEARATLLASGIGIQRITDIRTPRFLDDSDRFNMNASFDFVLTYQNTLTTVVPGAAVTGVVTRVQ